MSAIPIALAFALATQYAPTVSPDTIVTFATKESGRDPLAIHDNSTGRSYAPDSRAEAISLAGSLLRARHSIDLGFMQINDANLPRVSMTVADAFSPESSIRAGAAILVDAYQQCPGENAGARMKCATSIYNTGSATRGVGNGYVAGIVRVAEHIVPSVRVLAENFSGAAIDTSNGRIDRRQTNDTVPNQVVRQKPTVSLTSQLSSFSR